MGPMLNGEGCIRKETRMGIGDILWLFFMFSALQPLIRQKMLEASRFRVLHRFESRRRAGPLRWCIARRR
jgi:hypothetical protein